MACTGLKCWSCHHHYRSISNPTNYCEVKGLSNTKPRLNADAVPSLLLKILIPRLCNKRITLQLLQHRLKFLVCAPFLFPWLMLDNQFLSIQGGPLGTATLQQAVCQLELLYNMCHFQELLVECTCHTNTTQYFLRGSQPIGKFTAFKNMIATTVCFSQTYCWLGSNQSVIYVFKQTRSHSHDHH